MDAPLPRLSAAQAAARLGVKPASLYAYVSRGQLARERTAAGSTFDPLEVEAFARRRRRTPADPPASPPAVSAPGAPLMVLDTDIAYVEDDELFFRGRPVSELVEAGIGATAGWLWDVDAASLRSVDGSDIAEARRAVAALPASATLLDRLNVATTVFAATDPLRGHAGADHLARVGWRLLTGLPAALTPADAPGRGIPALLWRALSDREPSDQELHVLEAALVLVVDHDLAVSTLAGRIAASARGDGYAVVTAALGAFGTPLHGGASRGAVALLRQVVAGETPARALAEAIATGAHGVPGFGHAMYRGPDARAALLLESLRGSDAGGAACAAVDAVAAEVLRRVDVQPNIDLALAAMTITFDMPDDAGSAVFALGRTVGWIAHAVAELEERPMRLRPRGRYTGPDPA